MKNYTEGSASSKVLALILAGALVFGIGITAFAENSEDENVEAVAASEESLAVETEELEAAEYEQSIEAAEIDARQEDGTDAIESPEDESAAETETQEETEANDESAAIEDNDPAEPPKAEERMTSKNEQTDEEAIAAFFDDCLKNIAPEVMAMNEKQLASLEEAWMNNTFIYEPGDDILNAYLIEGVSDYTRLVISMVQLYACNAFVEANYPADESYITAFHAAIMSPCSRLPEFRNLNQLEEKTLQRLFEIVFSSYLDVREVENEEIEAYGESYLMVLYDSYIEHQGAQDFQAFREKIAKLSSELNGDEESSDYSQLRFEIDAVLPNKQETVLDDEKEFPPTDNNHNKEDENTSSADNGNEGISGDEGTK